MTDIAIRVTNLSKCYQMYDTPRDRLKQFVVPKLCRAFPPLRKVFPNSPAPRCALPTPHSDSPLPTSHRPLTLSISVRSI